jgi:hypothetical protein
MSPAYNPAVWSAYFSVEAGASAALTGLIFVAISINLSSIVISKVLVARAAKAICTLMEVLAATTFALVPSQPLIVLGIEISGSAAIVWLAVTWAQYLASHKNPYVTWKIRVFHMTLTQLASLQFIIGGISLCIGRGGGLYWLIGAALLSFTIALLDAWVLLIEIQR